MIVSVECVMTRVCGVKTFLENFERKLAGMAPLPALEASVLALERAFAQPETGAADLARILEGDPSLAAHILRVANSAYFNASGRNFASVPLAIARLGFRETQRLCTTIAVVHAFGGIGPHLDYVAFWKHSVTVGIATRVIQKHCARMGLFDADEAYVAGLLHDTGILILDQYFPEAFRATREAAKAEGRPAFETERIVIGVDHGAIGGRFLTGCRFPVAVVEAVTWHHHPYESPHDRREGILAVHLADALCTSLGVGNGGDGLPGLHSDAVWRDLGLTADSMPSMVDEINKEAQRSESLITLLT